MATTVFPYNQAGIIYGGRWTVQATGTFPNGARTYLTAVGSQIDFTATGTDIVLPHTYIATGITVTAVVDGGAPQTLTPNNADGSYTLLTGGTDTAHTVTLHTPGSAGWYVSTVNAVQVSGAAPAISVTPALAGTAYKVLDTTFAANSRVEGGYVPQSYGASPSLLIALWQDAKITFKAKCTTITIWTYQVGQLFNFVVDGVAGTPVTLPSNSTYGWVTLAAGLDATTVHEYDIVSTTLWTGASSYIDAVILGGGTGLVTNSYVARPTVAFYGDSITDGYILSPAFTSAWAYVAAQALQRQNYNRGINASPVYGSGTAGEARTTDITGISPAPTDVVILYGTNDIAGSVTQSQFTTAFTAMLTSLRSGLPSANLWCLGILPRADAHVGQPATYNGYMQTAITNAAVGAIYIDTSTWINTGTDLSPDNLHPNLSGNAKIATKVIAFLQPAVARRSQSPRIGTRTARSVA